jgi:sorting nexin-29
MMQSTNNETVYFGPELHIPEPSTSEVYDTVRKMKDNRAPGEDATMAELIKKGGKHLWENIHQLIVSIWNKEEIPEELRTAIICPIYKKASKLECKNYRGISLLNVAYKIFTNILSKYLKVCTDEIIGGCQGGVRKG